MRWLDGITDEDEMVGWHHQTQWTWVWASSMSWWRIRRPGVLHSMGSQRNRHNWATKLNWTEVFIYRMDIHSLLDKQVSGFQFWPITNKAAMNMCDLTFPRTYVFTVLGCVPRSGMSGSFCRCKLIDVRNCQTVLQTGYTILHSHQQCIKSSIWSTSYQHFISSSFFTLDILKGL